MLVLKIQQFKDKGSYVKYMQILICYHVKNDARNAHALEVARRVS